MDKNKAHGLAIVYKSKLNFKIINVSLLPTTN